MNKLLSTECAEELKNLLRSSRKIVLTCHRSPDGDALGSILGFADYLRELGKMPVVVIPDQFPDFFKWMPTIEKIVRFDKVPSVVSEQIANADLIVSLDYGQYSRVEALAEVIEKSAATRLVIDHHESPTIETPWLFSFPELSSKCIGMLLSKGIDKDKIYRNVYYNYSVFKMKFWGYVLYEKLHYIENKGAAYFALSKEELSRFHYVKGDAEGLINEPLKIKGCRLSISLREDTKTENKVWVSLRSVDDLNCITIAEKYFNGGGHLNASGGTLYCSLAEAEEIVRKVISNLK